MNKFEGSKIGYHPSFFFCREPIADAYILKWDVISKILDADFILMKIILFSSKVKHNDKEQSNHNVSLACGWWEDFLQEVYEN